MTSEAQALKQSGNEQFKQGNFSAAESYYSQAISLEPSNPVFTTNRAFARLKLEQWKSAKSDCLATLKNEPQNMKATYYLAQAQLGLHQPEDALASALQAYEICLRSDPSSAGPISAFILRAKKERWEVKESERRRLRDPLLAELEEKLETALEEKKLNLQAQFDIGSDQMKTEMERLVDMNRHKIEELRSVFAIADPVELASRVVPDYLMDSITFNIMYDPVMTNTGRSYERASILAHLQQSQTDPLTRGSLTVQELRPNIALRDACADFMEHNGWAAEY